MMIVFIIPDLSIGGLQWHLVRLANYLAIQTDVKVHVIVMAKDLSLAEDLDINIGVSVINGRFRSPRSVLLLVRQLRRLNADVIIGWSLYPSMMIGLCHRLLKGAKLVAFEANFPPLAYNFSNSFFNISRLYRCLVKNVDLITANSEGTVDFLASMFVGMPVKRCFNPVCLSPSGDPANVSWPSQGHKFLAVGRLVNRHKGFDLLLHASDLLSRRNSDGWSIVIVGDGPDRPDLEETVSSLKIDHRVSFVGRRDDVSVWMEVCDTFLLTSRFEGFPNVLIEALQVGTVSIATNCQTGPNEIIEDGVNGFLVPVNDATALANAMQKAINLSASERMEMINLGRAAVSKFGIEEAGNQFLMEVIRS